MTILVTGATGNVGRHIEFFMQMRTNPPEEGYTVFPTVEEVTGRLPRTFARWAIEHVDAFQH